jgi:integrase
MRMPKYRRGSGSVYLKRGWCYIKYYAGGKPIAEATGTKNKAEARRLLQARLGQLAEGRYIGPAAERVAFDDLAEMLLTDYRVNGRKSLKWIEMRLKIHLAPFFGSKRAQQISTADVQAYIAKRQSEDAKNGTINLELAALKRMYTIAMQAEKITRRPYIPLLEENNVRQGFFERAEFEAVLVRLPDWLRPPVTLAYSMGWRTRSEVLPLTWRQIDLEAGTVRLEVGTTKNKDGRVIYLTEELRGLLETQWRVHLSHHPDCPYVFPRPDGQKIKDIRWLWIKACRVSGLVGKIPHDFRRTAVRNMVRAGIPERVAMMISGHKTRAIFDRYHIVSDSDLKEAAKRLDTAKTLQTATISVTTSSGGEAERVVTH